jgi:phosphoribosylanthranilate isomerase
MFQIKICGITRAPDAAAVVSAGADAIGLNFYPKSRRYLRIVDAQNLLSTISIPVTKVGVFVDAAVNEILDTARKLKLEWIQLHGKEPADLLSQIPPTLSIVSVYRCDARGLSPLADYLASCDRFGRGPDAVLIDAQADGDEYGGTGRVADWERIARDREMVGNVPLILAGGLAPDNVADAIATVRPQGVDVASGVETQPGYKDTTLVQGFIAAAREAFARL